MDRHEHPHTHGAIDPTIVTTSRGLWAVKWSFFGLLATSFFQALIVILSGSVSLLADTIHNLGDALTAIPIGIAFLFARKKPNKKFTYGYGRVEDLAGLFVVFTIFASAILAGYESINRFFHPQKIEFLGAITLAAFIGFLGNEGVAMFRIKVGKQIGSAALIADGYHARTDGLVSLGVIFSVIGVSLGYPLADPIIGCLMTLLIFKIVWESMLVVFTRILDGVDPNLVDEIKHVVSYEKEVKGVREIRARWIGHRLYVELNINVDSTKSVEEGYQIANRVHEKLFQNLKFISKAIIRVNPLNSSIEEYD